MTRIAIIADIHDNLVNLEKCLHWCKKHKIEQLICCGDITNSETLKYLAQNFWIKSRTTNAAHTNEKKGIIHLVKGNIEIYQENELAQYNNIKYYGKTGRLEIDGQAIGICHEPYLVEKVLKLGDCDIIFYGHTHKPWESVKNPGELHTAPIQLINPGPLGGMFQRATFAVMDGSNIKLIILDEI